AVDAERMVVPADDEPAVVARIRIGRCLGVARVGDPEVVFAPERLALARVGCAFAEGQHAHGLCEHLRLAQPEYHVILIPLKYVRDVARANQRERGTLVDEVLVDRQAHLAGRIGERPVRDAREEVEAVARRRAYAKRVVPEELRDLKGRRLGGELDLAPWRVVPRL